MDDYIVTRSVMYAEDIFVFIGRLYAVHRIALDLLILICVVCWALFALHYGSRA